MDFNQIIQNFQAAMIVHGITPPQQIIADGQLHRFHLEGDKRSSKNGWYVLFASQTSCGVFGDWKRDNSQKWCSKKYEYMTFEERRRTAQQIAAAQLQRTVVREKEYAEAAQQAEHIYYHALFPNSNYPYLVRKMIRPFYARQKRSYLILPVIDFAGKMWGLQYISPNGEKWFLPNTAKYGHFIPVQHRPTHDRKILICEGFATGASLAKIYPNACVIAACDANNLKPVAVNIRQHLPEAELTICADDDQLNPNNPGINKGQEAAIAADALFVKPQWPLAAPRNLTDFNDLFCWLSNQEIAA